MSLVHIVLVSRKIGVLSRAFDDRQDAKTFCDDTNSSRKFDSIDGTSTIELKGNEFAVLHSLSVIPSSNPNGKYQLLPYEIISKNVQVDENIINDLKPIPIAAKQEQKSPTLVAS